MAFLIPKRTLHRCIALLFLLAAILTTAGCPPCIDQLKKAQDQFNAAYQEQPSDEQAASQQKAKFQQIVEQVDKNTLLCLKDRDDLKVQAYAIDAFAKWGLRRYTDAMADAQKGQDLYEKAGKITNPRDYGMLLIVPGYAMHSQAHEEYEARLKQGYMTMAEAKQFDRKIANALDKIDTINNKLSNNEEVVIRANQEQLRIVIDAIDMWSVGIKDRNDWEPEVRRWLARAEEIAKKFPSGDYSFKARTEELLKKIENIKKSLGQAK